jgi:hypothetical protein
MARGGARPGDKVEAPTLPLRQRVRAPARARPPEIKDRGRPPPFWLRRRLWRSLHRVVAVPVSIGLATLMVAVGTSSFCTSGASPSAGASGWSLSSRAAPGWRCSHCAPQAKFGHHNSAAPRATSMRGSLGPTRRTAGICGMARECRAIFAPAAASRSAAERWS